MRLAPILALCAAPAFADGPTTLPGDPCAPFLDPATYATQFPGAPPDTVSVWYATGLHTWADACLPPINPWAPGRPYSDVQLLRFLLSGHHVPAPVPIPPALPLLLGALVLLWLMRRTDL